MKSKILQQKQSILYYLTAFTLPFSILFLVLFSQGISWNSDTTILASDGFHQYVIFAENFRNILHGTDSIFYTFTSGLGLNFYALMSYYLGSFFSIVFYFFKLENMPDAIYLITLLKIGCIGLTCSICLKQLYKTINHILLIILSASYALMSFSISQLEINMWLDIFILVPLIILGLHRLLDKRKFLVYYFSLTILFIQNYYFGYMMAIFLFLYFLVQLSHIQKLKEVLRKFLDFTIVSILADLSSAVMTLPTYLDLSTQGEKFTKITDWFTDSTWVLDIFAKNFVGSYDTTQYGAIPMIYVGIFPLLLAIIFFSIKAIKWQVRLSYGLLIAFIIISFYIEPLDLFWQGMHSPNMFLHRYAWILSTIVILLAAKTLSHLEELTIKNYLFGIIPLFLGFGITAILSKNYYDFLEASQIIITLAFLTAYSILLYSYFKNHIKSTLFIGFIVLFTIFEISLNTYYQITALNDEWVFPSRESYERNMTDIETLVDETKATNNTFYRMERILGQTGNDSMKYSYNGISQFSSIRNTTSSSILDRLGYKSTGTNLNLRYQNNTILMDSLFSVKYNLTESYINKYGFTYSNSSGETSLYENHNASQLSIMGTGVYTDVDFTVNTLDNQTHLINQLTGLSNNYYMRLNSQMTQGGDILNNQVIVTNNNQVSTSVTYQVDVPTNTQLYVSVPNIDFSNDNNQSVQITVNGTTAEYTTDNAYSFFDLGYFPQEETISVTFTFSENNQVTFDNPNFYSLNIDNYQKAMDIINSKDVTTTTTNNTVTTKYNTSEDSYLFFTIPYDKGWTAKVNGKSVEVYKAQDGFMAVNIPKGQGTVSLTFIPNGFKEGAILSILGLISFIFYCLFRTKILKYLLKNNK